MGQKSKISVQKLTENKPLMYGLIVVVAMVAFAGVYFYTGGDFSKLSGAAISCGDKTATPNIELVEVKDTDLTVEVTVKATDDCGLAKVERLENTYRVTNGVLAADLIYGNEDVLNNDLEFVKTYVFTKANYELSGGEVKMDFTAYDASGLKKTISTNNFKI